MKIKLIAVYSVQMVFCVLITVLLTGCGIAGQLSYQPFGAPLEISVDTNGNVNLTVSDPEWDIPTAIGTFSVGVVLDPAKQFGRKSTLTVRFNGQDHIYDLEGKDFEIKFTAGYYKQVDLSKKGKNVLLELRRIEPTQVRAQSPRVTATPRLGNAPRSTSTPRAAPIPTRAPTKPPERIFYAFVTADPLNVRRGPGADYGKVAQAYIGDRLDVYERSQDGRWLQVVTPRGVAGWVSAEYVQISASPQRPATATPPPTPRRDLRESCAQDPGPRFKGIWDAIEKRSSAQPRLGCPLGSAYPEYGAAQVFQKGYMLWIQDSDLIYVLHTQGSVVIKQDNFREGVDPEKAGYDAPSGKREPIRGFGKVWREELGGPSARIGWAIESEYIAPNLVVQEFEKGLIFWEDRVGNRVLFYSGHWEQW